jgi:hypothetical protein
MESPEKSLVEGQLPASGPRKHPERINGYGNGIF